MCHADPIETLERASSCAPTGRSSRRATRCGSTFGHRRTAPQDTGLRGHRHQAPGLRRSARLFTVTEAVPSVSASSGRFRSLAEIEQIEVMAIGDVHGEALLLARESGQEGARPRAPLMGCGYPRPVPQPQPRAACRRGSERKRSGDRSRAARRRGRARDLGRGVGASSSSIAASSGGSSPGSTKPVAVRSRGLWSSPACSSTTTRCAIIAVARWPT